MPVGQLAGAADPRAFVVGWSYSGSADGLRLPESSERESRCASRPAVVGWATARVARLRPAVPAGRNYHDCAVAAGRGWDLGRISRPRRGLGAA